MNPGKVQDSKVTTFSAPSVTRGRSARPHPTLANFLNRLPDEEVGKGLEQMEKTMPRTPPITQSASILMTAPRGIKSKGRSVWWEEIELWVTRKGMEPFLLPPRKSNECLLVPSVNQNLARQGLIIDRVVWERREFGRPAARLRFFPQHKQCKHSYTSFQKPAGVQLGYVVMQPVITPTCRGADSQAPPMPVTPTSGNRPTGRESGHESGSPSNDTHNSTEGLGRRREVGTDNSQPRPR